MPGPSERRRANAVAVGVLAAAVAFVGVLQVRSQAEVVRSLEGQDNTSLAFLIDDLHRANASLSHQAAALAVQRDTLRSAGGAEAAGLALGDEAQRLRVVEGLVPVHGPGVVITVDAALQPLDLQDAVNNLRAAGAEALAVNDRRILTGTVFRSAAGAVAVDGVGARGPWLFAAIGDPLRLAATADLMTRSLQADKRVRSAAYHSDPDLQIRATTSLRPFVYGST